MYTVPILWAMLSIKVVSNQCYCNPYHQNIMLFSSHYLSTIFTSFSCSITDPSEKKTTKFEHAMPSKPLYTWLLHRAVTGRVLRTSNIYEHVCVHVYACASVLHPFQEKQTHWMCCADGRSARPSEQILCFRISENGVWQPNMKYFF